MKGDEGYRIVVEIELGLGAVVDCDLLGEFVIEDVIRGVMDICEHSTGGGQH